MYFDRFDIVEAHYAFCCDYHGGQSCPLYAKIGRILKYFKPAFHFMGYGSLSENGKEIYNNLVKKLEKKVL